MSSAFLLFPHQLFEATEHLKKADTVYLIEEHLFFKQYAFHKQKLLLHRASMKHYEQLLRERALQTIYIETAQAEADVRELLRHLAAQGITHIFCYDPCDNWLEKRISRQCAELSIRITEYPTALFLNTKEDLKEYFASKNSYFQTDFYIRQRKKWSILLDDSGKPLGGKWSFDADNRLKYPKDKTHLGYLFPLQLLYTKKHGNTYCGTFRIIRDSCETIYVILVRMNKAGFGCSNFWNSDFPNSEPMKMR